MILINAITIHDLELCAEVIRKSFQTVAADFNITFKNNQEAVNFLCLQEQNPSDKSLIYKLICRSK